MEEMFQTVIAGYFIFCLQNRLWGYVNNLKVSGTYTYPVKFQKFSTAIGISTPTPNLIAAKFSLANSTITGFDYWAETEGVALRYIAFGS